MCRHSSTPHHESHCWSAERISHCFAIFYWYCCCCSNCANYLVCLYYLVRYWYQLCYHWPYQLLNSVGRCSSAIVVFVPAKIGAPSACNSLWYTSRTRTDRCQSFPTNSIHLEWYRRRSSRSSWTLETISVCGSNRGMSAPASKVINWLFELLTMMPQVGRGGLNSHWISITYLVVCQCMIVEEEPRCDIECHEHINGVMLVGGQNEKYSKHIQ